VSDDPEMLNICGGYSLESVRGSGASTAILSALLEWMREHGYMRLGVDFESFNRLGSRFWLRHFEPFTYSLFRRIDERVLWANGERLDGIVF
jgi:GNAT superfamily N-acetyltransferase